MALKRGIFPFSVDRSSKQTLVEQVSANMRQAILCGDWPFGMHRRHNAGTVPAGFSRFR